MISNLILPSLLLFFVVQGLEPSPSPKTFLVAPSAQPPSLEHDQPPADLLSPPSPAPQDGDGIFGAPSLAPDSEESKYPGGAPLAGDEVANDRVRWCTVQEEYVNCQQFVRALGHPYGYTWRCVQKDTALDCLSSIKNGESDITNLEAGLAYKAFINHSMKAIAHEIYRDHSRSYDSVAVVNREACTNKKKGKTLSMSDFRGRSSCHGSYSSASGWNYPISFIKNLLDAQETEFLTDREIAVSFFSGGVCAPSDIETDPGTSTMCGPDGLYSGDSGAFRCLVEGFGDIAFVRGETVVMYSMEAPYNQSWSTKSIRDFMYLCPDGGCREINGYPGSCSLGAVPANVIMAHNSLPNDKRLVILRTLTNRSFIRSALYSGNASLNLLFSPGTQEISAITELTRSYLGESASISQSVVGPATNPKASNLSSNSALSVHASLLTELLLWMVAGILFTRFTAN